MAIHNISSSNLALGRIQTHEIPMSFFDIRIRIAGSWEVGMLTRDINCRRLFLGVPTMGQRLQFLSPDSLRRSVSNAPRHRRRAQRISDHNRCLTLVVTRATMAIASILSPIVTFWRWHQLFVPSKSRFPYWTATEFPQVNPLYFAAT